MTTLNDIRRKPTLKTKTFRSGQCRQWWDAIMSDVSDRISDEEWAAIKGTLQSFKRVIDDQGVDAAKVSQAMTKKVKTIDDGGRALEVLDELINQFVKNKADLVAEATYQVFKRNLNQAHTLSSASKFGDKSTADQLKYLFEMILPSGNENLADAHRAIPHLEQTIIAKHNARWKNIIREKYGKNADKLYTEKQELVNDALLGVKVDDEFAQFAADTILNELKLIKARLIKNGDSAMDLDGVLQYRPHWEKIKAKFPTKEEFINFMETANNGKSVLDTSLHNNSAQVWADLWDSMEQSGGYINWDNFGELIDEMTDFTHLNTNFTGRPRVKWASPEAFKIVNDATGSGAPIIDLQHTIEWLARRSATLEVTGYTSAIEGFESLITKITDGDKNLKNLNKDIIRQITKFADINDTPAKYNGPKSAIGRAIVNSARIFKDLNVASLLGSSGLTALGGDSPVIHFVAKNLVHMDEMQSIKAIFNALPPKEAKELAEASGLILYEINDAFTKGLRGNRFSGYETEGFYNRSQFVTSKMAEWTMNIPGIGLSRITETRKNAITLAMNIDLKKALSKYNKFDDIPELKRNVLTKYGIDNNDWQQMKKIKNKGQVLDIIGIDESADNTLNSSVGLQDKLFAYLREEGNRMIMSPSRKDMAIINGELLFDQRPGSVGWHMMGLLTQFLSFPMAVWRKAIIPHFKQEGVSGLAKAARFGQFMATSTVMMGMFSYLKDVVAGRELYDLENPDSSFELARRGFMMSGLMGPYMNFLIEPLVEDVGNLAYYGERGHTWSDYTSILGPTFSWLFNVSKNGFNAALGSDSAERRFWTEMMNRVPFQNVVGIKVGFDMAFKETVQEAVDPKGYGQAKQRARKRMRKEGRTVKNPIRSLLED